MKLPMLDTDKANHVVYGAAIAALASVVSVPVAIAAVLAFGVAKEVHDYVTKKGVTEFADFAFTLLGGAFVLLPLVLHN